MMLVEEGLIGFEQPIGELLPELANLSVLMSDKLEEVRPAKRQPTVRDLLTPPGSAMASSILPRSGSRQKPSSWIGRPTWKN
jgi:hypothetical protein